MRAVEKFARAIAPLSWAALGAGDTLAHANRRKASIRHTIAGFRAMHQRPPDTMIDAIARYMPSGSRDIAHHALVLAFSAAIAEHEGRE